MSVDLEKEERKCLDKILIKISNLKSYLNSYELDIDNYNWDYWYDYLNNIKDIIKNYNTDISFISCLAAKKYLMEHHKFDKINVALKAQTSSGFDIDEYTVDNERVVAEIKATVSMNENDLGSNQLKNFLNDFEKLRKIDARYKYFFMTEERTYNIIKNKYQDKLINVKVILLK